MSLLTSVLDDPNDPSTVKDEVPPLSLLTIRHRASSI